MLNTKLVKWIVRDVYLKYFSFWINGEGVEPHSPLPPSTPCMAASLNVVALKSHNFTII